jgi:hypothetical protein
MNIYTHIFISYFLFTSVNQVKKFDMFYIEIPIKYESKSIRSQVAAYFDKLNNKSIRITQ